MLSKGLWESYEAGSTKHLQENPKTCPLGIDLLIDGYDWFILVSRVLKCQPPLGQTLTIQRRHPSSLSQLSQPGAPQVYAITWSHAAK